MANKRKDTMEIKQIIRLHCNGLSNRKIGDQLGISRNTINHYIQFFQNCGVKFKKLKKLSEEELYQVLSPEEQEPSDRFKELSKWFPEVVKASKQTGFTLKKMWEEYAKSSSEAYSLTQFCDYYRQWNQKTEVTMKLDHKAGQTIMVDYAGKTMPHVDKKTGIIHQAQIFVACLPASGYLYVEASPSQQKGDFIQSMINCLSYIGGVPSIIICDNLKSAVTKASKYEPITNRTFRDMAEHYGAVLNPTRPYKPQDKAMAERMVRLVYEQILFPLRDRTFYSLYELNEAIKDGLEALNLRPLSQMNTNRRDLFLSIEKDLLSPLPPEPYQTKSFKKAKVNKTSHVYLSVDKHYYSVPCRYIGHSIRIHFTEKMVEVFHNHQRISSHLRDRTSNGYSTKKEHLASHHQAYSEWSPKVFIEKATRIGPYTAQYVTKLFDQTGFPETKYRTAMGIIQLKKGYEKSRIERACKLGLSFPSASYQRLVGILEKNLDQQEDLFEQQNNSESHIPKHDNIRGNDYYFSKN